MPPATDDLLWLTALAAAAAHVLPRLKSIDINVLPRQTDLAAATSDVLAATGSDPHSVPQYQLFGSAQTEWGHLANPQLAWHSYHPTMCHLRSCPVVLELQRQYEAIPL
jgi:hypothetical protein